MLLVSLLWICAVEASTVLGRLVMATRVTRGYMPETAEARVGRLAGSFEGDTHTSVEVREAIKSTWLGSHKIISLLRPIIKSYGKMCAAVLCGVEVNLGRKLKTALKQLQKELPLVLEGMLAKHELLEGWAGEGEKALLDISIFKKDAADLTEALEAFSQRPTYTRMQKASHAIYQIEEGACLRLFRRPLPKSPTPREILQNMRSSLNVDMFEMRHWASRFTWKASIAEFDLLQSVDKSHLRSAIEHAASNHVLGLLIRNDFATLDMNCELDWTFGEFPGDRVKLQRIIDAQKRVALLKQPVDDALVQLSAVKANLFVKGLKMTAAEMPAFALVKRTVLEGYDRFEAADREDRSARLDFVKCGLRYIS